MSAEEENVVEKGFLLFHVPLVVPPEKKMFVNEIHIDTTRMAGIRLTQVQKKMRSFVGPEKIGDRCKRRDGES